MPRVYSIHEIEEGSQIGAEIQQSGILIYRQSG